MKNNNESEYLVNRLHYYVARGNKKQSRDFDSEETSDALLRMILGNCITVMTLF